MPSSSPGVPAAPEGTWVATTPAAQYKLTFDAGNAVTLDFDPYIAIGSSEDGTFRAEGDLVYIDLHVQPMVLKSVNDTYESTSPGTMLTFIKQ